MSDNNKPPLYQEHEGTIRVAGSSRPLHLAQCAQSLIAQRKVEIIDFFYIGGNAGQQAMKAMGILSWQTNKESGGKVEALYHPIRVMTLTHDEHGKPKEKDATVWRLVLVTK